MFSVFMVRCLRTQGYFPDPPTDVASEDEILIGKILFHFLEVLQFNAHEVAQFEMLVSDKENKQRKYQNVH